MGKGLDMVMLLGTLVDFFLLQGTKRLTGCRTPLWRLLAAAVLGGVYGAVSLLPDFRFLGGSLWRAVFLGLRAWLAFGEDALGPGCLFLLLSLAFTALVLCLEGNRLPGSLGMAALLWLLCRMAVARGRGNRQLIPLRICHGGKELCLTALRDTGNTLRDPVTGERVLVLGAEAARHLLGLTPPELRDPLHTMEKHRIPGLRLIPYRAVGSSGLLLALRLESVSTGTGRGSMIGAFAPEGLDGQGGFQALLGGMDG